jgi:hypothetical protein
VYPAGGIGFQVPQKVRQRQSRWNGGENMHVISRAVDQYDLTAEFTDDTAHVGEKTWLEVVVKKRGAVFGAENYVCQQVGEGVSHVFCRPSGAWLVLCLTHGSRRGLNSFAAPQLKTKSLQAHNKETVINFWPTFIAGPEPSIYGRAGSAHSL